MPLRAARYQKEKFQSTPSVGRATATQIYRCLDINISIHALRGEGDRKKLSGTFYLPWDISIHALRGEGDCSVLTLFFSKKRFQSTPSVGRATI